MGHLSADYIHVCAEALKLAFADRDKFYGDPLFVRVPIDALLSRRYNDLRAGLIDMATCSREVRPGDPRNVGPLSKPYQYEKAWPGGTTTCCVADRFGNVVSATPSGNGPYHVCASLGIAHGNRLRSLNTTPDHPNRIQRGKRPRITLTPTLVLKNSKPIIAISVAGGDLQDQAGLNLFLNNVEFGMLPAQAVSAQRFSTGHHENSFKSSPNRRTTVGIPGSLHLQNGIPSTVQNTLKGRGHAVHTTAGPIARPVMIYIDQATGMIYAAGDPAAGLRAGAIDRLPPRNGAGNGEVVVGGDRDPGGK
jgi:gamma-glutamyltranspeptidase/glutathione hydrolase